VELLVVISITTLLVALLLPALGVARRQARVAVCQATMRQQGLCVGMYISDCKDYLPAVGTPHHWSNWASGSIAGYGAAWGLDYINYTNKYQAPFNNVCPYFGANSVNFPSGFGWPLSSKLPPFEPLCVLDGTVQLGNASLFEALLQRFIGSRYFTT
jgi:hypothetical protein